jgi:formylmethanofuran dehydrogenase subunit E
MKLQPFAAPLVKEKDTGLCDECGEYTDELRFLGSKWLCERCAEDV